MGESTACVVRPQIAKSLAPTAKSLSSFFPAFLEGAQSLLEKENMAFKRVGSGITHLIDVVHFGWKRSSRILAKVSEFGVKLFHMTHVKTRSEPVKKSLAARCLYCLIESHTLQDQGHANSDSVGASGSPPVSSAESEQQTFSNQRQIFNAAIQLIQDQ